ncbi:MAG: site-specific integrase [Pseudomonadota bacterium]|nr:site-specific integrase [Pseudomonadota bacterium]
MALKFTKLTRISLRRLQTGRRISEHSITFERLSDGHGRYTVNIMVDGQRVHRVIGKESDGVTRKQTKDFIEKAKTDARQSQLNLPKGRKLVLRFQDAAAQYLHRLAEEDGKDIAKKRERLDLHLTPFFRSKPLAGSSAFDVDRYKKHRQEEGTRSGTINRELAVLSQLFTKAVEWNWLTAKPATIKRLPEDRGRITYLTIDQIGRLIEAAKRDQSPHIYPFIVIGLETSMRRMEILSIRLEHIYLRRRVIYIPTAKAGAREQSITKHTLPLFSPAM